MTPSRLDKYLRDATALSRSQIKKVWEQGKITVRLPGAPHTKPALEALIFAGDEVYLEQERVQRTPPCTYAALNKPYNVLSSAAPPAHEQACTLYEWLAPLGAGVFPVGRLDQETQGLMLLTDDGDLSHVITHPDTPIPYTYQLVLDDSHEEIAQAVCEAFMHGVQLAPDRSVSVDSCVRTHAAGVTLSVSAQESRSRQLRSMCHVLNLSILSLQRTRIGPVELNDLAAGAIRALSEQEIEQLWGLCGGRERVQRRRYKALVRQARRHRDEGEPHMRLERWLEQMGIALDSVFESD